jgi:hypothetical protein
MNARELAIATARAELGLREDAGPNRDRAGKIAAWLKACGVGPDQAWCAAFASYCLRAGGVNAKCAGAVRLGRTWPSTREPLLGDLIWYPTDDQGHGHIGLVEQVGGDFVVTIEGNQRNAVRRVRRHRAHCNFTRVPFAGVVALAPDADLTVELVTTTRATDGTR